jgi:uncharacterized protein (TIGR03083 family)
MDYAAALIEQNRFLGDVVFAADLSTPVPTCPGWTLLQLLRHVGRGDRWAAQIIRDRAGSDLDPRQVRDGRPPDDAAGARAWLDAGPQTLLDAVAGAGPDTPVSTFLGPRPAAWWIRRRLHEATVHRADAALAAGHSYHLSAELAADGIDEWLDRLAVELPGAATAAIDDGVTIGLHASDIDAAPGREWHIRGLPAGIAWERRTAGVPAQVRLTGPAADLFLALVRRRTVNGTGIRLDGDAAVWQAWLAGTPL